jgi:hypothetical protein
MNSKKIFFLLLLNVLISNLATAKNQEKDTLATKRKIYLGAGVGINYGAFGVQANYLLADRIRFAAGYGANGYDMVWNLGMYLRIIDLGRFTPTFSYMYGYQNFINLKEVALFNKAYYGSSFGVGVEIWNRKKVNYLHIQGIYHVNSSELIDNLRALELVYNTNPDISSWAFSVGMHFGLGK